MELKKKVVLVGAVDSKVVDEVERMLTGLYGHAKKSVDKNSYNLDMTTFYPAHHWKDEMGRSYENLTITVVCDTIEMKLLPDYMWTKKPYSLAFGKLSAILDQIEEVYKVLCLKPKPNV